MKQMNPNQGLEQVRRRQEILKGKMSATPRQDLLWFIVFLLIVGAIVLFVKLS